MCFSKQEAVYLHHTYYVLLKSNHKITVMLCSILIYHCEYDTFKIIVFAELCFEILDYWNNLESVSCTSQKFWP